MADFVPISKASEKGDHLEPVRQSDLCSFSLFVAENRHGAIGKQPLVALFRSSKRLTCFSKF